MGWGRRRKAFVSPSDHTASMLKVLATDLFHVNAAANGDQVFSDLVKAKLAEGGIVVERAKAAGFDTHTYGVGYRFKGPWRRYHVHRKCGTELPQGFPELEGSKVDDVLLAWCRKNKALALLMDEHDKFSYLLTKAFSTAEGRPIAHLADAYKDVLAKRAVFSFLSNKEPYTTLPSIVRNEQAIKMQAICRVASSVRLLPANMREIYSVT